MKQLFPVTLPIVQREFVACLISLTIFISPIASLATPSSGGRLLGWTDIRSRTEATGRFVSKSVPSNTAASASKLMGATGAVTSPMTPFFAPSLTASLADDIGLGAKKNPGDTITYTATITNGGASPADDATGMIFSAILDSNTTLVPGSINAQPIAKPDSYTGSGNIPISIAAPGVLTNDVDPMTGTNAGLTVTEVQGLAGNVGIATDTTAVGGGLVKGSVILASNGSFIYEPPPGFTGNDTFTYKTSEGTLTDTNTVTITISNMVWFIKNTGGGLNRGTFSHPFTSIAAFNSANALADAAPNPKSGDFIALRTGTYAEADGVNLRGTQKLIGEAVQFNTVFTADSNSSVAYTTFAGATNTAPAVSTSAGNGIDLASGNTVRGLNVGNTPGFFGFNGTAVGSPVINTVAKTGTGGAINVSTSGAFGANVTFATLESSSSPGANINLVGVTGTLGITSGGTGLTGSAASSHAINLSGGSVGFTYPGNVTKASLGALLNVSGGHTGTLTFNTGTLSATAGTGLQFDNADGAYNFNGTTTLNGGDAGVDILNGSGGTFGFTSGAAITNPTGVAFDINNAGAQTNVTYNGTISTNANRPVSIQNVGANSTISFTGNVTSTNNGILLVTMGNPTSVTFSGGTKSLSTGANTAVSYTGATGNTVTFSNGGLAIARTTGAGVVASGGGTLIITRNAGTANTIGNTNSSAASNGTALSLDGVTIGTGGLVFESISQNGGSNGIFLQNTGSTAGLTLAGNSAGNCGGDADTNTADSFVWSSNAANAADCTGGTIQNTDPAAANGSSAGVGIFLNNTRLVNLTRVKLNDHSNHAIKMTSVVGFIADNLYITGANGTTAANDEGSIWVSNLSGTSGAGTASSITNSTIEGGREYNLFMVNSSATTLDRLTIDNCTFGAVSATADADDSMSIESTAGTMKVTVNNSKFTNGRGDLVNFNIIGTSTADIDIDNVSFSNNHASILSGGGGVTVAASGSGDMTYTITDSSFRDAVGDALLVRKGFGGAPGDGTAQGTINNNHFGVSGVANSGSSQASAIEIGVLARGLHYSNVTNNTIYRYSNYGILIEATSAGCSGLPAHDALLHVKVQGNLIAEPNAPAGGLAQNGIHANIGTASNSAPGCPAGGPADAYQACLDIGGVGAEENSFVGSGALGGTDFRLRQRFSTTIRLPGYAQGSTDTAAVIAFIQNQNTGTPTGTASTQAPGGGFVGGADCTAPSAFFRPENLNRAYEVASIFAPSQPVASAANALVQTLTAVANENRTLSASNSVPSQTPTASSVASSRRARDDKRSATVARETASHHAATNNAKATRRTDSEPQRVTNQLAHNHVRKGSRPNEPIAEQGAGSMRSSEVRFNHAAKLPSNCKSRTAAVAKNRMDDPALSPLSGETVTVNGAGSGFTLPGGDSITITFQATVNTPPGARSVSTQGKVSGSNFTLVNGITTAAPNTNDPETGAVNDATVTNINVLSTWTGATSTDWNTITNWTPNTYAPGVSNPAVNDVVIPNVGNQPTISATDIGVYSLNISNGRTLTITNPRILTIGGSPGGDLTLDGIISGGFLNLGTGTHAFNVGASGSLSATNVATVLSGSTVTLNNNLPAGALAVNAGGSMNISSRTLSLNGSGAALTVPGGATFTTTSSTVAFNGTAAQQAAGISYNNLTINNTLGAHVTGVTLIGNATVNGVLTLTSSDLATGAFTLTMPVGATSAPATGATDVVGNVKRTGFVSGGSALSFGNPLNTIRINSGTAPTDINMLIAKNVPATYALAVQRSYTITPTGGSGINATVRLHYRQAELNGNDDTSVPNFNFRRFTAGAWKAVVPTARNTNVVEDNWLENNTVTTFSEWTFANLSPSAAAGTVSGIITTSNGTPVEGAVVRLSGDQTRKTITDAKGRYHFDNVDVNGFYTVTPSRVNYHFTPFNRAFTQLGNQTEAAFGAVFDSDSQNPLDTPEYFVRQQYVDILGREPDEGGFNYWSDEILKCGADAACVNARRSDIAAAFFIEQEFQQTGSYIYNLYQGSLARRPGYSEYAADRRQVIGGPELETEKAAFAAGFVQRPDFVQKYQSHNTGESFVDALLANVWQTSNLDLGTQRGVLLALYQTGSDMNQGRALVLRQVGENPALKSVEYNPAFVLTEYFGYLRRNPEPEGYDFWLNVLNHREPGNFRGMVCSFITSTEYQRRFSSVVTHSNAECGK